MGLRDIVHRRGERGVKKPLGNAESTLAGIMNRKITKNEACTDMAERLVRHLAIEEALQDEIKDTL